MDKVESKDFYSLKIQFDYKQHEHVNVMHANPYVAFC
jgi:hypothetical protein